MKNATKQSTTLTNKTESLSATIIKGGQIIPADRQHGNIWQQNSTHVAIENVYGKTIEIWIKGFVIDENTKDEFRSKPEYLYSIPKKNSDDLFAIFERFDEDNRVNRAEFESAQPTRPSVWYLATTGESVPFGGDGKSAEQSEFDNHNWQNFKDGDVVYLNDRVVGIFAGYNDKKNRVYIRDKKLQSDMNNVRIVERWKSAGDVYHTGDNHSVKVFEVVRDMDESDIWSKNLERGIDPAKYYTKEVIEKGHTIEMLTSRELAEYILTGLIRKKFNRPAVEEIEQSLIGCVKLLDIYAGSTEPSLNERGVDADIYRKAKSLFNQINSTK